MYIGFHFVTLRYIIAIFLAHLVQDFQFLVVRRG